MMKLIKKITYISIISITLISCGFKKNSFENYQSDINEILNPNSSNFKHIQNIENVKDMSGCGYMAELNPWYNKKDKYGTDDWGRRRVWHEESGIISYSGFSIDSGPKNSTPYLITHPLYHIIYIGPWHLSPRINKNIRFYSYTGKHGGYIMYQFESQTTENKNIPEKKFSLPSKLNASPDKFGLCVTKWIANYGYNAIAEVKSKNPFSKNYLVPTGNVIEVEE